MYGYIPLNPLDLLPMPNSTLFKHKERKTKAKFEKKNESCAKSANMGHNRIIFEPEDWVWFHMRKERFPSQIKSNLMPRGSGLSQVVPKVNDNAYKIDLPDEYGVSATLKVADLSPFDVGDDFNWR